MSKPVGRIIGQWIGVSAAVAVAGTGIIALRHALETPQPLKSALPGEAHLYRWRKRSVFYKLAGPRDASPLVLLHRPDLGISGHEMIHIMAPLAETHRVYALDLLGFGLSDRPDIEYSAQIYNELILDFLREVVQRPATLVASGLSCNYALAVASQAPELCTSLALIAPFALQGETPATLKRSIEKPPVKALLYPLLSTHLAFLLTRLDERADPEDFGYFYASTHQLGAEHASMARLAGKLSQNNEQDLQRLQQPVLMIWGTHALDDQRIVSTIHRAASLLHPTQQIRKVELIQEAGLAAHVDQPEAVVALLQRWQSELESTELAAPDETSTISLHTLTAPKPTSTVNASSAETASARTSPRQAEQAIKPSPAQERGRGTEMGTDTTEGEQISGDRNEEDQTAKAQSPSAAAQEITAYCVKCKQKRTIVHPHMITMKNGRPAMRGTCAVCGTQLTRIGGGVH